MRPATFGLTQGLVVVAVFILDRLTKIWAQAYLQSRYAIAVCPFFHLTYVQNTGAAWGMFRDSNRLLIGVSMGLLAALFYMKRRWPKDDYWMHYGAALIAGGALGNLYDRITLGYVVDFFDFLVWPVFNVADSCISVGAVCLALGMRRTEKANQSL